MFRGLANLGSILKSAQQIRGQMGDMAEKLKARRATGSAGGGMVEMEVNGLMEVLRCSIDESLAAGGDRELLEDLITAAMNETIRKGKELHAEVLQELTGGIPLPGLQDALSKFMGADPAEGEEGVDDEDTGETPADPGPEGPGKE